MVRTLRRLLVLCLSFLLVLSLCPYVQAAGDAVRWQDYNGKRIGVMVGPLEDAAAEFFPDSEYFYFNSYPDCATALLAGKIDGFLGDEPGIYEDGATEQIFEHPKKELTRRFIKRLRVLEFTVDTRDFDFIGAGAEIDRYCLQNDVSPKEKNRIRLAVEELTQQILLPLPHQMPIHVSVEHSERDQSTDVAVSYGGDRFDPKDTENELSYTILGNAAERITYAYDAQESLPNRVEILIRNT